MVTFEKNPYDWAGKKRTRRAKDSASSSDSDINSAVVKLDLTYKDRPLPASSIKNGLSVTVSTGLTVNPKSFTNATLSEGNNHTAVITVKRVSPDTIVQLYIYVGKMTPKDLEQFKDLSKLTMRTPFIFAGYINITLFHGNGSDALKALEHNELYQFAPVWLYNFRFVIIITNFVSLRMFSAIS